MDFRHHRALPYSESRNSFNESNVPRRWNITFPTGPRGSPASAFLRRARCSTNFARVAALCRPVSSANFSSSTTTVGFLRPENECFIDGSFAPAKKGAPQIGPTKRGKGTKGMGTGRWRGYSAGSIPGRGVPGGGHAPREHARESADPREARTSDRRSRLRQQRGAPLPQAAAHSAAHSRSLEQHPGHRSGRALSAPLSPALDRRADDRLARQLPPADRLLATYGGLFHLACALLTLRRVLK